MPIGGTAFAAPLHFAETPEKFGGWRSLTDIPPEIFFNKINKLRRSWKRDMYYNRQFIGATLRDLWFVPLAQHATNSRLFVTRCELLSLDREAWIELKIRGSYPSGDISATGKTQKHLDAKIATAEYTNSQRSFILELKSDGRRE